MTAARSLSPSTGLEPYIAAVGLAGSSKATAEFVELPVAGDGEVLCTYIPVPGRALTLLDGLGGILRATSSGNVAMTLPNRSININPGSGSVTKLGHAYNPNRAKRFRFQKCGAGGMFVSPVDGTVTINNPMALAPDDLPAFAVCTLIEVGDNVWAWI